MNTLRVGRVYFTRPEAARLLASLEVQRPGCTYRIVRTTKAHRLGFQVERTVN